MRDEFLRWIARGIERACDAVVFESRVAQLQVQADRVRYSEQWDRMRRRGRVGMPRDEARRKVRALARWELAIDEMRWLSRVECCPTCVFGDRYLGALDKAEKIRGELGLPANE